MAVGVPTFALSPAGRRPAATANDKKVQQGGHAMSVTRKTRIGTIGLASLLAAALSVGLAATAGASVMEPAMEERPAFLRIGSGAV